MFQIGTPPPFGLAVSMIAILTAGGNGYSQSRYLPPHPAGGQVLQEASVDPIRGTGGALRLTPMGARLDHVRTGQALQECVDPGDAEMPFSGYWTSVQNSLAEAATTTEMGDAYFATQFVREIDLADLRVSREEASVLPDPVSSMLPVTDATTLASSGYITGGEDGITWYHIPTPQVLIDPVFIEGHCFNFESATQSGEIVLRFSPRTQLEVPDVSGRIFLDIENERVRAIEFQYVSDPSGFTHERIGGEIHFRPLDGGGLLTTRWTLRTPMVGRATEDQADTLIGFRELGRHIVRVVDLVGAVKFSNDVSTVVHGTIIDGTRSAPLGGAIVALQGTDHWTVTNTDGTFFLAGPFDGSYDLVFGHPRLDSLGFVAESLAVDLPWGAQRQRNFAVPPVSTILNDRCPDGMTHGDRRILIGMTRRHDTGEPIPGAVVSVSWQAVTDQLRSLGVRDLSATAVTNELGSFTFCNIPVGRNLKIQAATALETSDFRTVTFRDTTTEIDGQNANFPDPRVGRLDLAMVPFALRNTNLSGVVTDAQTGGPLRNARVALDGTPFLTSTNDTGGFLFRGFPAGPNRITVRNIGYRTVLHDVDVVENVTFVLPSSTLAMHPISDEVVTLDPILVEANAVPAKLEGFQRRRETGLGSFTSRDDFERWHPSVATDVLRRMRGVRVSPNLRYGTGGDTRRWIVTSRRDMGFRMADVQVLSSSRSAGGISGGDATQRVETSYECPLLVFLDGTFVGDTRDVNVNDMVAPDEMSAVEFYTTSEVPARFNLPGSTCGVVVFWTRTR